jgi:hypothetical protein
MLGVVQVEEIERLLARSVRLVDLQERRSSEFASEVLAWIRTLEAALEANRLPAVSLISAERSKLLAAMRDPLGAGIWNQNAGGGKQKAIAAAASAGLSTVVTVTTSTLGPARSRFDEASQTLLAILTLAHQNGWLEETANTPAGPERANRARMSVEGHGETVVGYVRVKALVGEADALILLDRTLVKVAIEGTTR